MKPKDKNTNIYLITVLLLVLLSFVLVFIFTIFGINNKYYPFNETTVYLDNDWTLTDQNGNTESVSLPHTVENGTWTLSGKLPDIEGMMSSPTLEIYSNYTDITVYYNNEAIYSYPENTVFPAGTGNTYHYIRLPSDSEQMQIDIVFKGQIGNGITYLLRPVGYGSRAAMLNSAVKTGLPIYALASSMLMISLLIISLAIVFRRNGIGNSQSIHLGVFTMIFAAYIALENKFSMLLIPHSEFIYTTVFLLLALMAIPIIMFFMHELKSKFRVAGYILVSICWLNYLLQNIFHFCNIINIRVMMPVTHIIILISIFVMFLLLFFSGKGSRNKSFYALPIALGGVIDITLLSLNRPSMNNNFFFSVGVMCFIISQFVGFIISYLKLYRDSVESRFMRTIAYTDALTGLGNRSSYENILKELNQSDGKDLLCCIVADINGLKMINDNYGHSTGDEIIKIIADIISSCTDDCIGCFRTGGDEFVVFRRNNVSPNVSPASEIQKRVNEASEKRGLSFSLAVGYGTYEPSDGTIEKFVSRIDAVMYNEKKRFKMGCGS